jgi:hypothetical protein
VYGVPTVSVEDPNVIDFIAYDENGTVVLIMVEGRHWDGSDARVFELQEKIKTYVSFVADGQLIEQHPDLRGKPVRLELRCVSPPDPKTAGFLRMAGQELENEGLSLKIQQIRRNPSG